MSIIAPFPTRILTSQQEADLVLDGYRAARDGEWAGDCPHGAEPERAYWLSGFRAFHQRTPAVVEIEPAAHELADAIG